MEIREIGRGLMLLGLLAISAGCVARPTMAELEEEASRTGDWSAVERREARIRARLDANSPDCPIHLTKVCVELGADIKCYCVRPVERN